MRLPDFYVAGFPKCGTTTLYAALARHPDALVSENKEPHFFDVHYEDGVETYARRHFSHGGEEAVAGEATPNYLFLPYALDRILETTRDARFVVALRDPVERAYSEWWMYRNRGTEHRTFEEAIDDALDLAEEGFFEATKRPEQRWTAHYRATIEGTVEEAPYVEVGQYAKHLDKLWDRVSPDQIHLILLRHLKGDPEKTIARLLDFLDLPTDDGIPDTGTQNARLGPLARPVALAIRTLGVKGLIDRIPPLVRGPLKRMVTRWGQRPPMNDRVQARLADHFGPWNARLARDYDLPVSHWTGTETPPASEEVSEVAP